MLTDHDCLNIDISDFSIEMELLGLSYESISEPEEYVAPVVSEYIFGESLFERKPVPVFLRM